MKTIIALLTLALSNQALAGTPEIILGFTTNHEGITYQVTSGGCTSKEDFSLLQLETFPVRLRLDRENFDGCEAYLPYGTTITYTWAELGMTKGTKFFIANEVLSPIEVR